MNGVAWISLRNLMSTWSLLLRNHYDITSYIWISPLLLIAFSFLTLTQKTLLLLIIKLQIVYKIVSITLNLMFKLHYKKITKIIKIDHFSRPSPIMLLMHIYVSSWPRFMLFYHHLQFYSCHHHLQVFHSPPIST